LAEYKKCEKGFGFWLAFQPFASVSATANGASGRAGIHVQPLIAPFALLDLPFNNAKHSFAQRFFYPSNGVENIIFLGLFTKKNKNTLVCTHDP